MSDPVLVSNFPYIYFTCDRDPTSDEPVLDSSGLSGSGGYFFWWNQTTNNFFFCTNAVNTDYLWQNITTSSNILTILDSSGWDINTSRSSSFRGSPEFNTSYTPSATNDTSVTVIVDLTSTLLTPGTVELQVNSGSGYTTKGESSISGISATIIGTINYIVPANSSYKLINSSGTASIVSIDELTM